MIGSFGSFAHCFLVHVATNFHIDPTPAIVGYDPQKLLPHKPMSLHDFAKSHMVLDASVSMKFIDSFFPKNWDLSREWIDFDPDPKIQPPTRFYIEGGHFDMQEKGTRPGPRKLAPFVTPTGRISYPTITRFQEPREYAYRASARYDDSDSMREGTEIHGQIEKLFTDWSSSEARALAVIGDTAYPIDLAQMQQALADHGIKTIYVDPEKWQEPENKQLDLYRSLMLDADSFKPKKVATAAGKRDMSYLKHDPSKRHDRRPRKGGRR